MSDPMLARRELIALLSRIGIGGLLGGTADRSAAGSTAMPAAFPAAAKSPRGTAHMEVGVRLDRGRPGVTMTSRFVGLSYEKDKLRQPMFTPGNDDLLGLYRLLGPGVLRIGANAVDRCAWLGGVPGLAPIQSEMVDALTAFAKQADWQVIYGINLANNTTARAAAEASYAARALGDTLSAFEIGRASSRANLRSRGKGQIKTGQSSAVCRHGRLLRTGRNLRQASHGRAAERTYLPGHSTTSSRRLLGFGISEKPSHDG
ncbi:putative lipoprotein [Bradyrhizobium oligotrophicum S58]|uniref:Putative lipoprotein n=1 Tax=Bradyrhizobium oligotrophicum S58 TaxID=1245469 RepID=M4Z519_9BRAD|nr:hypothetical protein [Bradyrhizobium oligotrophicum]BAM88102.1 putative lipoprotein [Bradyrhizobium oligotrophicum S58]